MSFIEDIDNEMNARSVAYGEKAIRFIDEAIVDLCGLFEGKGLRILAPKHIVEGINDYFRSMFNNNFTAEAVVDDGNMDPRMKYKGIPVDIGYEMDVIVYDARYTVCVDPNLIRRKLIEI